MRKTAKMEEGWPWQRQKNCFSGSEAVDWVLGDSGSTLNKKGKTRQNAIQLLGEMQKMRLLHHVTFSHSFIDSPKQFYRLHRDDPGVSLNEVGYALN